ncbi:MAG TPA: inorganic phosphate transporter [Candidatus Cloacimonadota bacterium]|nr:inorganic phosphate transporter [Candidatus Cloacimonadota bacterium]HPM00726.1 inorganic phosphate transporter [Candidatus Cloacimonadota bacterium]
MAFILLISGLFLGWSLGANDAGNIFGAAVETRMIKFKTAAWIASIFVILGAVIQGGGTSLTLSRLGSVNALAGSFTVALAAGLSLILMVRLRIPVSSSQAVVGSIIGWNIFTGAFTDISVLLSIVSAWIITPVLSALFTLLIYHIFNYCLNRYSIHIIRLDFYTRIGLIVIGAFGAYSLGANNIANVMGMFIDSSPFTDIYINRYFQISGISQLFFIGALAIAVGIFTYSQKNMRTVGHDLFKLSPLTGLIVVLSSSMVLFMFSSRSFANLMHLLHLPALPLVPVSSSQAVIGSIVGLSLSKGIQNMQYKILGRISIGWIVNPVFAGVVCFISLFVVQNVFDQVVFKPSIYRFDKAVMIKLDKEGIDINKLSILNGQTYYSSNELRKNLSLIKLDNSEKQKIADISFIYPIRIEHDKIINRLNSDYFNSEQLHNLHMLHNHLFYHKWQLNESLEEISETWAFKDKRIRNEYHNRELQKKYSILYKNFQLKTYHIE